METQIQNHPIKELLNSLLLKVKLDDNTFLRLTDFKGKILGLSDVTDKKTVIYIDKNSLDFCAEIVLHELNEIAIFKAIKKISDSDNLGLEHKKETDNVAHFLNAYSLNQYYTLDYGINPFKNYIESDRLPIINEHYISLNPKKLDILSKKLKKINAYAFKHKGFSVFHKTDIKKEVHVKMEKRKTRLRNKNKIMEKIRKMSVETIEDIAVFSKNKTEKTIANRLLRLYYKHKKQFQIEYVKGSSCEFPEFISDGIIEAYSLNHCANIIIDSKIKPRYKRYFKESKEFGLGIDLNGNLINVVSIRFDKYYNEFQYEYEGFNIYEVK